MTNQAFAQAQADALRARLREEFPESEVWVGLADYSRQIQYRVDDYRGICPVDKFPDAVKEIMDLVRIAVR